MSKPQEDLDLALAGVVNIEGKTARQWLRELYQIKHRGTGTPSDPKGWASLQTVPGLFKTNLK